MEGSTLLENLVSVRPMTLKSVPRLEIKVVSSSKCLDNEAIFNPIPGGLFWSSERRGGGNLVHVIIRPLAT